MTTQQQTRRVAPVAAERPTGPAPGTLDEVFAHTAGRHPSRVAIQDGRHRLTYAQAERQGGTLASALVLGGVQLGDPLVVDCADHRQALVAQLGVLKAGGVCVPPLDGPGGAVDAARHTGARAILCSRATYDPRARGVPSLALDDPATWRKIAAVPPERALPRSSPEGGAHLLLDPHGPDRLIDHRSWLRSAADRTRRVGAPAGAVAVDQGPLSRPALAALWWAFSRSTALHTAPWVPDPDWPLDGAGDDVALLTPEAYARHLDRGRPPAEPHRTGAGPSTVVLIGSPCPRELVARHFAARPGVRLWSEFAPTDGAVPWTAHELLARDAVRPHEPGAGSPVPPVRLAVRGARGATLPRGESGTIVALGPPRFPEDAQDSGWRGRWTPDHTLDITAPPATARGPQAPSGRPEREAT
ncbi:AMP-binding protein [Streptomyces sp. DSM 41014]|uniref:AMP-binding protein n=1 Tax=Streptomyces hintoniae TaxID=3075521 RepID=A0ABU2UK27_9ACTN|nr:AMP-binding protein [Streptomyces sp. DSM 41014]MDT0473606.1 AMP-binding protein [Streptomyces sp. DSM 41014]